MDRPRRLRAMVRRFLPEAEAVEGRLLLAAAGALGPNGFLRNPPGYHLVRPNTPVAPFGAPLDVATFVDPTVRVSNGNHVVAGKQTYVGPYAALDARVGYIKIGSGSTVLDNAAVTASPAGRAGPSSVLIGDRVSIGFGAVVNGPSLIGAYGDAAANTGVGANAVVNGAVIAPGAVVGALAYVGPGVIVPAGLLVKPGAAVTTEAEATDPALGKVEPIPGDVADDLSAGLARAEALANGYAYLYQGQPATGTNPGVPASVTGIYNGNLAAVLGTSQEPGPSGSSAATGVSFEPKKTGPKFPGPYRPEVEANVPTFPARITGDARFAARVHRVASRLGRFNAFRADQGQPIRFADAPRTGRSVVINSPLGGTVTTSTITGNPSTKVVDGKTVLTIDHAVTRSTTKTVGGITVGTGFRAADHAVLLGGPGESYTVGDNVSLGVGSVVTNSNLGTGVVVGDRAYVADSTVPAGTVIPPGAVVVNNTVVGTVQW